jgi:hypothetical protein
VEEHDVVADLGGRVQHHPEAPVLQPEALTGAHHRRDVTGTEQKEQLAADATHDGEALESKERVDEPHE